MSIIDQNLKNRRNFEYLITGCGRSGTEFLSYLLNENGVSCGHECYFGVRDNGERRYDYGSESSWLAVPYVGDHPEAKIIKLYRDPISHIKSILDLGYPFKKKQILESEANKDKGMSEFKVDMFDGDEDLLGKFFDKHTANLTLFPDNVIATVGIQYVYWNGIFDKKIGDIPYELINFNTLVKSKEVEFYGKIWNVPDKKINSKDEEKKYNFSEYEIIAELKKMDVFYTILDYYESMNNHPNRSV